MAQAPKAPKTVETPRPVAVALEAPPGRKPVVQPPSERGGAQGPEPTRYGDWQHKGRVSDF